MRNTHPISPTLPPPAPLLDAYRSAGLASDLHIGSLLPAVVERWPWLPALVDRDTTMTFADLGEQVGRVAAHLSAEGVQPGDAVCWQTPNWWESVVIAAATWHLGAVSVPIVMFYRQNELRQILTDLRPAAVVTVPRARGFDHADEIDAILASIHHAPRVRLMVRGSAPGWTSFEALEPAPMGHPAGGSAEDPCAVLYTSGTTGRSKGAIHSSRSLMAATEVLVREWGLGWSDTGYLAAPVQHVTGLLIGLVLPLITGSRTVVADGWDPRRAVEDIVDHHVTYSAGTTLFLQELVIAAEQSEHARLPLKVFSCGGSPVPRSVVERAAAVGIPAVRIYGMTELPCVSLGHPRAPIERRASTDGSISPGVEVRVVDADGVDLPPGVSGELLVRGPELISGYVDPSANGGQFLAEGWFRTGDTGTVTASRDVIITGRLKDIINRGGEKFSTREIEDHLISHPSVQTVAVVPGPDARFGEVPAAFLVMEGRAELDPEGLIDHLKAAGLPNQKLPVYWRSVAALPTTAAGKIKKFELMSELSRGHAEEAPD